MNTIDDYACEFCGRNGADHKTPNGSWIHRRCGMRDWEKLVARENRRKAHKATAKILRKHK